MTAEAAAIARAIRTSMEAACDVVEEDWGTLVTSPEFHSIHRANFLWLGAMPPGGLDHALARLDASLAPYGIPYRILFVADDALADAVTPEMKRRGFGRRDAHIMAARRGADVVANPAVALRPARDQSTRDDHDAVAGLVMEEEAYDHETSHQLLGLHWRRAAELEREVFVAYLAGEPVGNIGLDDVGGVGLVYNVETVPERRGRGVATTMVLAMRARAVERGLTPLGLETATDRTTWRMYERQGFDRIGTLSRFSKLP